MELTAKPLLALGDTDPALGPPRDLIFRRRLNPIGTLRELYGARALLRTLAERDLRVRYKQTVLGLGWAILSPTMLMLIFTFAFGRAIHVSTGGPPYPLFSYLGLLPWTFFSNSLSVGGLSLVNNIVLLNKIYCPREVFPLATTVVSGVDTVVASLVLGVLFAIYRTAPATTSWWVIILALTQLAFTVGVTLVVSSVLVYWRDLRHLLPILLQAGLFLTPVAYGFQAVPAHLQIAYAALNPLGPIIDGYRRAVLLGTSPRLSLLGVSAVISLAWLLVGYTIFKRLETRMADVA